MRNVVFIGMPGCGKTTVSRQYAREAGRPWFDSDLEIEQAEGTTISALFARRGEAYFRARETACIAALLAQEGAVIAVGGGAVVRNAAMLREGATVVYLRRSIEGIRASLRGDTRPLLREPGSLETLYEQRRGLYENNCDFIVDNEGGIEETLAALRRKLP